MATGKVVRFNQSRGYGFIARDGSGEDVFFHVHDVTREGTSEDSIRVGTRVEFESMDSERGPKAYQLKIVEAAAGRPREDEDEQFDIVTAAQYGSEITDAIVTFCPDATGAQIMKVRERLVKLAIERDWLD